MRLGNVALPAERADEIADGLETGRIAACLPFLLEAGYSARTGREHDQLLAEPLHYDHDYDLIAEKTDLTFDSVWLAPRGTL